MNVENELLKNLDRLHTTELGVVRIKKNLSLETNDVVNCVKLKQNLQMPLLIEREKTGI